MSDTFTVQVKGISELQERMKKSGQSFKTELKPTMLEAVNYVHSQLPSEESIPQPSFSTYHRTGTMMREINTKVRPLGSTVVGFIGAKTIYAPYVIDENRQARIHRGRWWTLQKVVREQLPQVQKILQDWVHDLLSR